MKPTIKYRPANRQSIKVTIPRFMDYFGQFSKKEQSQIARRINKETFEQRWMVLDKSLPDIKISDTAIMKEIRAVRHGRK